MSKYTAVQHVPDVKQNMHNTGIQARTGETLFWTRIGSKKEKKKKKRKGKKKCKMTNEYLRCICAWMTCFALKDLEPRVMSHECCAGSDDTQMGTELKQRICVDKKKKKKNKRTKEQKKERRDETKRLLSMSETRSQHTTAKHKPLYTSPCVNTACLTVPDTQIPSHDDAYLSVTTTSKPPSCVSLASKESTRARVSCK